MMLCSVFGDNDNDNLQYYIAIETFAPSPSINKCALQLTKFYDMCQLCL